MVNWWYTYVMQVKKPKMPSAEIERLALVFLASATEEKVVSQVWCGAGYPLQVSESRVRGALRRLVDRGHVGVKQVRGSGLIKRNWLRSDIHLVTKTNYYRITPAGQRALADAPATLKR